MDRNRLPCRNCSSYPEILRDVIFLGHGEYAWITVYRCSHCGIRVEADELEFPVGTNLDSVAADRWDALMR